MNDIALSTKIIRRRLVLFVVRAIAVVFGLTVLINLGFMADQLSRETRNNPYLNSPTAAILEGYFLGNGSWEGVENVAKVRPGIFEHTRRSLWENTILVDHTGRVVLEDGAITAPAIGSVYQPDENAKAMNLTASDRIIGKLYIKNPPFPPGWSLATRLILSVLLFSIVTGIIILVIGMLLLNRLVSPLSEVIGATQAVAKGDLSVRVPIHKHNDDLHTLSEGFNSMAEALERTDNERRNLFADIAHELRTPLTVLRGRLEGVMDGVYPLSQEVIAPALAETYFLERLVEDLRILALADAHQLHFEVRDVEIGPLIQRVIDLFTAQASEHSITLRPVIDADVPRVQVDPQRLEQGISNLLDNALRYAPPNTMIDLVVRKSTDGVEIDVMDEGPGVAEEDLALIFNRFWRGEKSRTRSSGGSGLGLAITKQLVEAQGGTIRALKRSTGGLIIRIVLPAKR